MRRAQKLFCWYLSLGMMSAALFVGCAEPEADNPAATPTVVDEAAADQGSGAKPGGDAPSQGSGD